MICIVGGRGSIGRRYQAICNHLKIPFQVYDVEERLNQEEMPEATHFIVCTPTHTHIDVLNDLKSYGKPILCEKPISKSPQQINIPKCYTVCNYKYLVTDQTPFIEYDFFHSGRDGLTWDCCQLIYLDPMCELKNQSPFWTLKINGKEILYRQVEQSYVSMIQDFYKGNYEKLWTLEQGIEMTREVIKYESRHTHTSEI